MELALKMGSKKFEDKVLRIERSVKKDKNKEDTVSFSVHKIFNRIAAPQSQCIIDVFFSIIYIVIIIIIIIITYYYYYYYHFNYYYYLFQ